MAKKHPRRGVVSRNIVGTLCLPSTTKGGWTVTEVANFTGHAWKTVRRSMDRLMANGFVTLHKEQRPPSRSYSKVYRPTPELVAVFLKQTRSEIADAPDRYEFPSHESMDEESSKATAEQELRGGRCESPTDRIADSGG